MAQPLSDPTLSAVNSTNATQNMAFCSRENLPCPTCPPIGYPDRAQRLLFACFALAQLLPVPRAQPVPDA